MRMKKIVFLILAVAAMAFSVSSTVYAQNKAMEKSLEKESKLKAKELEKDGWKIYGSSRSLEEYNDMHETLGDSGIEVSGFSKSRSVSEAYQAALNDACSRAASHFAIVDKGVLGDSDGTIISVDYYNITTWNHYYSEGAVYELDADYEALVAKKIRDEIQESFAIHRDLDDGEKAMRVTLIFNYDALFEALCRVYEAYLKEGRPLMHKTSR